LFLYTVRPGDTIYSLATQFNIPIEEIISANPGIYPYNLLIGQQIMIPTASGQPIPYIRPPRAMPPRRRYRS